MLTIRHLPLFTSRRQLLTVIDAHAHVQGSTPAKNDSDWLLVDAADRLGIDMLCCSALTCPRPATIEGFQDCNRRTYAAMKRFPGRVLGYCYVNSGHQQAALEEIRRCVEELGMIGIKLYNEYRCSEPVVWPIVELAIELKVPILEHAGHSHRFNESQPRISDGGMLAELGQRYPEAMLICGHIGGGGDWEWTIKALRAQPTVYLDTSGSVVDEGMIEMAHRYLGADRLLFACDLSMTAGIGKLRGANIPDRAKSRIFGENMLRILKQRG